MSNTSRTGHKPLALGLIAIAVALVAAGVVSRRSQASQVKEASTPVVPLVSVLSVGQAGNAALELPARIEPWARAPIYARVSGYLKSWNVDIGATVKSGQTLADIETPDLDQQLLQAKAELATARSNLTLASSTAKRWQGLLAADAVSHQEADEKAGDLAAKQSAVNAMQANVDRVQALQHYTRLVAPFDGVITARNTDVGALINVGGAAGSELFVVSDISRLRVYVNVPQRQVAAIKVGDKAELSVPERPGKTYTATVQALAQAINANSGAMQVQLTVQNDSRELLPGGYASIHFDAPLASSALSIPPSALIFNKAGTQVATLGKDDRVVLKPITVGRDLGNVLEIASGIDRNDRVIANPPDGVATGDAVRVAAANNAKGKL
ncbi:RND family efflux transporter, MFP subunit [Duganella sp. CF402]|uniref:efflux RND transporter periplasmic adaptor subunit n=1 Tax=unclassified Duganella TaxID=2636909 RepID=UPI0008D64CB8|nr:MULTISPECIES: efflux RND transporter periplasmic adaptor subunit [unclassified Duganella]RZT09167.1 RND family efflux transporter MFP subunit [Duganella sp. BK701]SEL67992.1 RND family efflux transporter, MFP subunit [Duganella sp. CF402]